MTVRLLMKVRVDKISSVSPDIKTIEFTPADREYFPVCAAGSNIIFRMKKGLSRQYSVCNSHDPQNYRIAVKLDPSGRGGSQYVHEHVREKEHYFISYPQPDFSINPLFSEYIFIAGGIGITPILSFIYELADKEKKMTLHYCVRHRQDAIFLDELNNLPVDVVLHCSNEGSRLDIERLLNICPENTVLYYCGSARFNQSISLACQHWPTGTAFSENFSSPPQQGAILGEPFIAEIPRSGHTLQVSAEKTLLQVLLDDGVDIDYACEAGTCRSCIIDIISGEIQHKDHCLTEEERKTLMTPCVSRGKGIIVINSL
ncbi:PDR/VanB family oxidoreductase [Tatumella citrea]|uniref:Ferredoxin n=1 Tax=Tatumella citrea TaxID=53336 RepID=A0A1Y0LIV0_TATCI|nr:PDR/VanB family oxidoreductase [Tatumella citrea]ARU93974.1 hypothetical protein A7K98_09400 [Tatumella citrea]ARU98012.1 hypothetical protein A7K99_09400 [Tatumella citrea]